MTDPTDCTAKQVDPFGPETNTTRAHRLAHENAEAHEEAWREIVDATNRLKAAVADLREAERKFAQSGIACHEWSAQYRWLTEREEKTL